MATRTAFITGASVGIGHATAIALADCGYRLILLARRRSPLEELSESLSVPTHIIECDINDRVTLESQLGQLPVAFENIDVLINNAGLALGMETADKASWEDWDIMIQTNCVSLAFLTRQLLPRMVKRNSGHIINLGSIAGNYAYQGGNVYGASKAFVKQFSRNLRTDLLGTDIRVTNLEPGMISNTEFSNVRFHGDDSAADAVYQGCMPLLPQDIAESIRWVVSLPPRVNINSMEIMPTCQAPAGLSVHKA